MIKYPKGRLKRKKPRTTDLIAVFDDDGYATGWTFAIKRAYRDSLDIRQTKVVLRGADGKTIKGENGKSRMTRKWTQGMAFNFEVGNTFYSDRLAYDDWNAFVDGGGVGIEIDAVTSSGWTTLYIEKSDDEIEIFYVYEPGHATISIFTKVDSGYDRVFSAEMTIVELINILWHGLTEELESMLRKSISKRREYGTS